MGGEIEKQIKEIVKDENAVEQLISVIKTTG